MPVIVLATHQPLLTDSSREVVDSLVSRGAGQRVVLEPLSPELTLRLLKEQHPELSDELAQRIATLSSGLPYTALELARRGGEPNGHVLAGLPAGTLDVLQRVALLGVTFSTDELLAVSHQDEDETYRHLEVAVGAMLVEPAPTGWRFRHALLREAVLERLTPAARNRLQRDVAQRASAVADSPIRQAKLYLDAGLTVAALPYVVRAVDTVGALGAYRDALALIDAVLPHATGTERARLLARRGDVLLAIGEPDAVSAYAEAAAVTTGVEHRIVRARLARAAALVGDLETARAAVDGLSLDGDAADGSILLAQGNVAYFSGDVDTAWQVASQARRLLQSPDDPWHIVDLVSLQGLIAHQRGEWFGRFRQEMRRTKGRDRLLTALFDAHLCVAEYLLYGQVQYDEVISDAEDLRRQAEQAGALRAVAFATALIGEAALLAGRLDQAEAALREAAELHREIDAPAGEAHSLQRLAEVLLARGDADEARRLLHRSLPLARWSVVSMHLLQRIYGTLVRAAETPGAARAVVDQAEAVMGETDTCSFCSVMLAAPAAIACADVGDLTGAQRYLSTAVRSAALWSGGAWPAAIAEAKAHLAIAENRAAEADTLLAEAAAGFAAAGQPLDVERCRRLRADRRRAAVPVPLATTTDVVPS